MSISVAGFPPACANAQFDVSQKKLVMKNAKFKKKNLFIHNFFFIYAHLRWF